MRRALLTVATALPAGPVAVGLASPVAGSTFTSKGIAIEGTSPATGSGTITQVVASFALSGSVAFVTGSLSGTNFTVRDISATFSTGGTGVKAFTTDLSIQAGDYIGLWLPSSGAANCVGVSGAPAGSAIYNNTGPTTKPTAGTVCSVPSSLGYYVQIGGTG